MVSTLDFTLAILLSLMAIIIYIKYRYILQLEAFGTSPGTLQQLAANHVPTKQDIPMLRNWWAQTQAGIQQMTEFDQVSNTPVSNYAWPGYTRVGAYN